MDLAESAATLDLGVGARAVRRRRLVSKLAGRPVVRQHRTVLQPELSGSDGERSRTIPIGAIETNQDSIIGLQDHPGLVGQAVDIGDVGGAFVVGVSKDYPTSTLSDKKLLNDPGNPTSVTYLLGCGN
jgi:hypothetical protein